MWQALTDRVIDLTYAAALGERPWSDLVSALGAGMPDPRVTLFYHDPEAGRGAFSLTHGFEPGEVGAYDSHWSARNPWMPAAMHRPIGRGVVAEQMLDPDTLTRTDFHDGFLRPAGLASATGVTVIREGGRHLMLSVLTSRSDPEANRPHAELLTRLAPHLARVLRQARGFDPLGPGGRQAIEALGAGAIVVGHDRRARQVTTTAERLLDAGGPVALDGRSRLILKDPRLAQGLDMMLRQRAPRALSAVLPWPGGWALKVALTRLAADALSDWLQGPTVIVLLTPLDEARADPAALEHAARAFGLTEAETQVLAALASGLTAGQIARQRGSSRETVRAQLRSLFAKTGTHRQSELIRLVLPGFHTPNGG